MLVLSRRIGEEIIIDGCIRVTITAIKGNQVRVGITAPPHVEIQREEVFRRLQEFCDSDPVPVRSFLYNEKG
jgi:carbon storage regulator